MEDLMNIQPTPPDNDEGFFKKLNGKIDAAIFPFVGRSIVLLLVLTVCVEWLYALNFIAQPLTESLEVLAIYAERAAKATGIITISGVFMYAVFYVFIKNYND